ncbi:MAG: hypothetical protein JJD97_05750 [Gemmatimonadaceae bacterium]|nr:hypothetical protein [Gemmatimonadaceae bacterium]
MTRHENTQVPHARSARASLALGCVIVLSVTACNKAGGAAATDKPKEVASTAKAGAISMCALMPKEAVNSTIGSAYTIAEANDDRSSSSCHYSSESDPAGMSLDLTWIQPSDYSDPAEHAALQKAGLSGAKLGGKLEAGMVPGADGGPLHIPSGPVEGIGDEATQNLLLLTARKGDYTLMVQIVPDVMKLMQDTTAGRRVVESERTLARAVLSKV